MRRFDWTTVLVLTALAAAAAFAADRALAYAACCEQLENEKGEVQETCQLVQKHPAAFGPSANAAARKELKPLVQQAGLQAGLRLVYLSEDEKDVGQGLLERTVVVRAAHAEHARWVEFLGKLETLATGARVRDLRVKPSSERPGFYAEAEAVLAMRRVSPPVVEKKR